MEVDFEVNTEKTMYVVVCRHQNAKHSHNLLITNKSCENVTKYKILGNGNKQNCIHG